MKIKKPESVPVYPYAPYHGSIVHPLSDLERDYEKELEKLIGGVPLYVPASGPADPSVRAPADISTGIEGVEITPEGPSPYTILPDGTKVYVGTSLSADVDAYKGGTVTTVRPFETSYTDRLHFDLEKIEKFDEISEIYRSWYPSDPAQFDVESFKELPGKIMREFASALIDEISKNDELLTLADVVKYLKKKLKLDKIAK